MSDVRLPALVDAVLASKCDVNVAFDDVARGEHRRGT